MARPTYGRRMSGWAGVRALWLATARAPSARGIAERLTPIRRIRGIVLCDFRGHGPLGCPYLGL